VIEGERGRESRKQGTVRVSFANQLVVALEEEPSVLEVTRIDISLTRPIPRMEEDCVGILYDLVSQIGSTQTVIDIVEHTSQPLVESVEAVKDVGSSQHARGRNR